MDAQAILWTDTDVYQRRYEKTATALIAVERVLRELRPLDGGEDEFLQLYEFLAGANPESFTQVWEDPSTYLWARRAYELTGASLSRDTLPAELEKYCAAIGTDDPRAALALHLEEFKKFVIAVAMIAREDYIFRGPLIAKLPFSIPGTAFSVFGSGALAVQAVNACGPVAEYQSCRVQLGPAVRAHVADFPRLIKRPVARCGEYELLLKPEAFFLPGITAADPLRELALEFQETQVRLIEDALALVERHHPLAFGHLREVVKLTALKPPAFGDYSNVSYSDLPGAFILSAVQEPYWIADALVHELFHNRLFFIEEREALLTNAGTEDGETSGEFYSPWRDDLRPLSGLLHAIYVYIAVSQFWFSVLRSGETSALRTAYCVDQAVRATLQLRIASRLLRRYAQFSEFGADLFREMEKEVDAAWITMHGMGLATDAPAMIAQGDGQIIVGGSRPDGCPLSVIETIFQHAARYDVNHQSGDLKSLLAAA